jgi:hypothetical protein
MALVFTTKGEMDEALLEKKEGVVDNENEHTVWIEYWHEGELVHRSAHVQLKKNVSADGVAAALG